MMSWRIAAASSIGTSHIATGAVCQDNFGVEILQTESDEVLVALVSDGAGSAANSEHGSLKAVQTAKQLISNHLKSEPIDSIAREHAASWINAIQDAIKELAELRGSDPREFACTLLIAIIGRETAAFVQVGDGAMVIASIDGGNWSHVFWPQHGEFANTTNFVTSSNAVEVFDFVVIHQAIGRFASFSDGIENLVLHQASRSAHLPFFNSMIVPVQRLENAGLDEPLSMSLGKYLSSQAVCERTDDDKSLILATRMPPVAPQQNLDASSASSDS
jgi:serine/threonine protein phosphatase PrpC